MGMAKASEPPVLCINLAHATKRWENISAGVARALPNSALHRIDAVDWRNLSPGLDEVPMTLFSRYLVLFPGCQPRNRLSHRQLDTPSSVAIMLSHIRCWVWLQDHPDIPYVVILEDDACFDTFDTFGAAWRGSVVPALQRPQDWDVLVLGYSLKSSAHGNAVVNGVPLLTSSQWFGMHAYAVTRKAVDVLLQHAFPMDHQSDGLMLTLYELGMLRVYLLPQSVSSQCLNDIDRGGSWHTHTTVMSTSSIQQRIVGGGNGAVMVLLLLLLLVLFVAAVMAWQRHGQ
jgi:GR25 family glycosyltransferase involved in LPS biosynthesis